MVFLSRLLSGNDVSSSSGDVPSEVITKGGDDKTAVTLDDDYTQPSFEDFEKQTVAGIKKILAQTDEVLENQDQMQSTLSDVKDTTSKTEAKVDALSYSIDALAKDVKETKTPSKAELEKLFKDVVAESINPATMQGLIETVVNSAVKKNKDAQGGQLTTPAAKKKLLTFSSSSSVAGHAGRPPISTAKKSRPSTLSIPGVDKHVMRQSEDAKKLAFDKKREERIIT